MRYTEFNLTEDELFELNMSPTNLQKMVKAIDARAGMEFELIIPNANGNEDPEYEPDYDYDEMCRSIDDAVQFFHDGDYNGRREVESLRNRMQNDYQEWLDEKIHQDWQNNGEEFLEEWVPNNVDESEWNPEGLEDEERQEALEEFIANLHADAGSSDAFDEFREENQGSYDESDWLDEEDLDRMSAIEGAYDISWPHWAITGNNGETNIEDVANNFRQAIGRPVNYSQNYHGGKRAPNTYVVEPDSSLDPDDDNDAGLEFVSPPLPISELLSDLDKIVNWAESIGAYTNDSTGLHMNVSVPDQQNLDYVKLAMFLGDNYILEQFGREGNTYCKSALKKIIITARNDPSRVAEMMKQFQSGLNQLASKVLHTGSTEKYTSINNRGGWVEFRGPGGNWLDGPADIKRVKDTLLRAVVALDVATKPDQFKQEYYKKLYKTLSQGSEDDSIQYFARYAAGELPKQALKSFVRQIQQKRAVGKQDPIDRTALDMPFVWRVIGSASSPYQSRGTEVIANSEEQAKARAVEKWSLNIGNQSIEQFTNGWRATPIRPASDTEIASVAANEPDTQMQRRSYWVYVEGDRERGVTVQATSEYAARQIASMERPGIFSSVPFADIRVEVRQAQQTSSRDQEFSGVWEVVSRATDDVVYRFNAEEMGMSDPRSVVQAEDIADRWRAGASFDDDIYVRPQMRAAQPVAGSTQDLARQRLAAQMPRHEPDYGNWEVYSISSNNTVYRFAANTEQEAVRAFHIWQDAIRNPGLPREGFNLRTTQGSGGAEQTAPTAQTYRVTYTGRDGTNSVTVSAPNATAAMDRVRRQFYGSDITNIEAEPAAETPARGTGSLPPGNARWLILDREGNEVYSFINTTAQSDANQYARDWMINRAPREVRDNGPFNIVPAR